MLLHGVEGSAHPAQGHDSSGNCSAARAGWNVSSTVHRGGRDCDGLEHVYVWVTVVYCMYNVLARCAWHDVSFSEFDL